MGWATHYINKLKSGETVKFRPRGNSMQGKISSGQLCTVSPINNDILIKKGDIVLCNVNGNQYLHLVKSIKGKQYKIANNKGYINGNITLNNIFGICIKVEN